MPFPTSFQTTCSIPNGAALSNAVALKGLHLEAIALPAGWTTAAITFDGSLDGGATYQSIKDNTSTEVTVTATAASKSLILPPLLLGKTWTHIKLRSGTVGSPVNQTGPLTLTLGLARY